MMRIAISFLLGCALALPVFAQTKAGFVVMHGKGGSPARFVADLASGLETKGFVVENLEMPWSGRRNYDVDVAAAEAEVRQALERLRGKGAQRVFVAGHSQGGLFALHLGGRLPLDGVAAIAPGGNVASEFYRRQFAASLDEAKAYVAAGKGAERQRLMDYESRAYPVSAVPAAYVTWFDPEGAMNQSRALKALPANLPVLYVSPTGDYPVLRRARDSIFAALPKMPYTRLYEPNVDHLHSPAASVDEIALWANDILQGAK
ncbi:MAG: alpha/beta fold hydrolase [Clostridia bacterium]